MIKAQIIEHSSSEGIDDLITVLCHLPKQFDAQLEKHRMISSNSSSDRAKPSAKMLKEEPFIPEEVYKNKAGMEGKDLLTKEEYDAFKTDAMQLYEDITFFMGEHKHVHKQTINRYPLAFSWQDKVMTATLTEWQAFFKLRLDKNIQPPGPCAAQPELQQLASAIHNAIQDSEPKHLFPGDWHLPFITEKEQDIYSADACLIMSAARCARTSYSNHDKSDPTYQKDLKTYYYLVNNIPNHSSPLEMQATPMENTQLMLFDTIRTPVEKGVTHITIEDGCLWSANFKGWIQHRKLREAE